MFYVLISNTEGELIFNSLPREYKHLADQCQVESETLIINGVKLRHGKIKKEESVVYGVTADSEVVRRRRYFKEILRAHFSVIPTILRNTQNEQARSSVHVNRLIHNLEALNGHNIQELFDLVSEEELRNARQEDKKALIQNRIKERFETIHRTILNVIKNNTAIKMEFSVFQKVLSGKSGKLSKQPHPLKKALMNVAHNFFQDFADKGIQLIVDDYTGHVFIDYEAFQVAFYQLFDNATKYALGDSDIRIFFEEKDNCTEVHITMVSLKINEDEIPKLVQEKYCGLHAKKSGKSGGGIGMFVVYKTLQQNGATLQIVPDPNMTSISKDGIQFERNNFIVSLPRFKDKKS